jgi:ABC-type branched-subunit amino acid transport system substrate-binding protein
VRSATAATLLLAVQLLLVGCAQIQERLPTQTPRAADSEAYNATQEVLRQDRRAGKRALIEFLETNPRDPRAPDAALQLARLHNEDGETREAAARFGDILRRYPGAPASLEARVALAEIQESEGDLDGAYRTLSGARLSDLDLDSRHAVRRRLATLAGRRNDPLGQLRWLAELRGEQESTAAAATDARIDDVIRGLPPGTVPPLAKQLGRRFPAGRLWLEEASRALDAGDTARAEDALRRAGALPLSEASGEQLSLLLRRLGGDQVARPSPDDLPALREVRFLPPEDPSREAGRVGVLLPLSGPYAGVGRQSLQGITLAAGIFDARARHTSGGVELVVRDTGGTAHGAERGVAELTRSGVSAIIGPLLGKESQAAAEAAQAAGTPLLSLSRREEIAAAGDRVFRFGLTPRAEIETLVGYATKELGLTRFGLLYPRDEYGGAARALFWDAVERRGGEVVAVAAYEPGATDFAGPMRDLVGYRLISNEELGAIRARNRLLDQAKRKPREEAAKLRAQAAQLVGPSGTPLPPFVDFEALFIPDTHQNVALVAPQLTFHEISGVRLLGLSDWNHPDLVAIGRKHVGGSVFTSAYFDGSEHPALAAFGSRYKATFGEPADAFAAVAYDTARLLLSALHEEGDAESLVESLQSAGIAAGVSGVTRLLPDGNAAKRPHLLGVHRGRIISVDEAGSAPHLRPAKPSLQISGD